MKNIWFEILESLAFRDVFGDELFRIALLLGFCADNAGVKVESLERLHHIMTAAAPTGPTLLRRFKKKAPSVILKEGK